MSGRLLQLHGFAVLFVALVSASGCAGTQNTLAQELASQRWDKCKGRFPTIELKEIRPDGSIVFWYAGTTAQSDLQRCLEEARRDQGAPRVTVPGPGTYTVGPPASPSGQTPAATVGVPAPVWKAGDEWAYRYNSDGGAGTYVWEVARIESLDGVDHYVIKAGTREIYYRTADLASSIEKVDGRVVRRDTPSRGHYAWPLTVGKTWEQSYRREQPVDRQTSERSSKWTVDAEEQVTVPAGSFRALKITERNKNTGALIYEMWYAPDVKQWVKIREFLPSGLRERELIAYKLR